MSKPRIFISIHYMEIGGAETSLLGLLQAIDYSKVDVDLFVCRHSGELMPLIPVGPRLLPEVRKYASTEMSIAEVLRMGYVDVAVARLAAKWRYSRMRRRRPSQIATDIGVYQYMASAVTPHLPMINPDVEYDLAVNFCGMQDIVLDRVRARRRAAWIHTDYRLVDTDREFDRRIWSRFDNIVSISSDVTQSFLKVYPGLDEKIIEIENILSPDFVRARAEIADVSVEMPGSPVLLSMGRLTYQKNFDNLPDIARRIVEKGYPDLRWYIIGYGGEEELVRSRIADAGMENHVVILGKRNNPYPYIKACDVYVQPSRYEGKSVAVREAQILGKPVVITDYPTASSQINHGQDGLIVPMDNAGCADAIAALLADSAAIRKLETGARAGDFGNMDEVNKFYRLIGDAE